MRPMIIAHRGHKVDATEQTLAALYTVTQGLALAGRSSGIHVGVALATAVMAILPVIVAYLFLQRYVIRSIVSSGVKG